MQVRRFFEVSHVLEAHSEPGRQEFLIKASLDCVVYFSSTLNVIDRNKPSWLERGGHCAMRRILTGATWNKFTTI